MSTQKFLAKNSLIVALTLVLSTTLGFVRESSIAYKFGATWVTDAYLIAMIVPMLFINLIKGSVTKTFITVYGGYLAQEDEERGWRMTNVILSLFSIILIVLVLLFTWATPWLVHLVAPSYSGQQFAVVVELMRMLMPSILFGGLMGVLVGVNNAHHSFLAPSLINVVSNAIMILSIFLLSPLWGIYGLAAGTLIGIIAQFIIQIPSVRRHGFKFSFTIDRDDPGVREMMKLVTPFMFSAAAGQINLIVDRMLATGLPQGIVSALYFANKLVFLPQNIFTIAVGTVVFPVIVRTVAQKDWAGAVEGIQRSVRLLSLVLLPSVAGLYVLRYPLVQLLFEHGAFTSSDTAITAETVPYFLGALFFNALIAMLINIYYATKKMTVPVLMTITAVAFNIGLSLWLIHPLQQKGLALANSLSSFINVVLLVGGLFFVLRLQEKTKLPVQGLVGFFVRVGLAATGMGLVVWGYLQMIGPYLPGDGGLIILSLSAVTLGGVVYAGLIHVLGIEEARQGYAWVARKIKR